MAKFECQILPIGTSTECNTRAGIKSIYLGECGKFDTDAIVAAMNANNGELCAWDPAWYDNGESVLAKWEFEREGAFYDQTYTSDTDQYEQLITIILNGKNAQRVDSLRKSVLCCCMAGFVFYNTGDGRMLGFDYDGLTLDTPIQKLRVGRHLDSSGTLGDTQQRDEIDLTGSNFNSSPYVCGSEEPVLSRKLLPCGPDRLLGLNAAGKTVPPNGVEVKLADEIFYMRAGDYNIVPSATSGSNTIDIPIANVSADEDYLLNVFVYDESGNQITGQSSSYGVTVGDTEIPFPAFSIPFNLSSDAPYARVVVSIQSEGNGTLDMTGSGALQFSCPTV